MVNSRFPVIQSIVIALVFVTIRYKVYSKKKKKQLKYEIVQKTDVEDSDARKRKRYDDAEEFGIGLNISNRVTEIEKLNSDLKKT